MLNSPHGKHVVLLTRDNQRITVRTSTIACCSTLKVMLEDFDEEDDEHEQTERDVEVPLPNVDMQVLRMILDFCTHCEVPGHELPVIAKPLPDVRDFRELVGDWYMNFVFSIPINTVLYSDLIEAANYLDCKPLLSLMISYFAFVVRKKTVSELADIFVN